MEKTSRARRDVAGRGLGVLVGGMSRSQSILLGCTSSLRLKLYLDDKLLAAGRPVWRSAVR